MQLATLSLNACLFTVAVGLMDWWIFVRKNNHLQILWLRNHNFDYRSCWRVGEKLSGCKWNYPSSFPRRLLMCHRTTPSKCSRSASSPKRRQPLTWQDCGLVIDGFISKPCINRWQASAVHENLPNNMCITEIVAATNASFDNGQAPPTSGYRHLWP